MSNKNDNKISKYLNIMKMNNTVFVPVISENASSVHKDDIFESCFIFGENEIYYFLGKTDEERSYYDIIMPKDELKRKYKKHDRLKVKVQGIVVADDGVPGVIVLPLDI